MLQHSVYGSRRPSTSSLDRAPRPAGARPAGGGGARRPAPRRRCGTPGAAGLGLEDVFEGRGPRTCDDATTRSSPRRRSASFALHGDRQARPAPPPGVHRGGDHGCRRRPGRPVRRLLPRRHAGDESPGTAGRRGLQRQRRRHLRHGDQSNLEGLALGVVGPAIPNSQNILGTGLCIPALGAVLSAMARDGDANVLATPHILATDNTKAEISIGQNIPLNEREPARLAERPRRRDGSSALGALSGIRTTAQRQDVGTKISVTPRERLRTRFASSSRRRSPGGAAQGAWAQSPSTGGPRTPPDRARSADRGHRRPDARFGLQLGDQDPPARRHPPPRVPLQADLEDQAEDEPPARPHPLHHPGIRKIRAIFEGARCRSEAGDHRPVHGLRRRRWKPP